MSKASSTRDQTDNEETFAGSFGAIYGGIVFLAIFFAAGGAIAYFFLHLFH